MTIYLKQSTASQEVPLGYFVDSTDGNTEKTALTVNNTDIHVWKTGATTLTDKNSGGATHISNGIYYAVLDATDTNTLGSLVIFVHVSGALTVRLECVVLAANIYDSMIGGGDILDVSTTQVNGTAISNLISGRIDANVQAMANDVITASVIADNAIDAGSIAANAITAAKIATGAIDADALATDAVDEIVDAVWDEDATAHQTQGTFGQAIGDPAADTDTIWGLVNTNLNATVSSRASQATLDTLDDYVDTEVAAIKSQTDQLVFSGGDVVATLNGETVTVGTNNDKTGYALTTLESMVQHSGTAQAGGASTITLAAGASAVDDLYVGAVVKIYGGVGASQRRVISDYNGTTKVATVSRAWQTNPDNTSTYAVLAIDLPALDVSLQVVAASVQGNVTGSVASVAGAVGSVTGNVGGNVVGSVASVTGNVGGNVVGSVASVVGAVGSVTGAVGSVTGNVGGNVTGSVGSVAAGGITAASIATDAIDADAIADNAINAGAIASGAITAAKFASGAIDAAALATDAVDEIVDAVWDEARAGHVSAGTFGQGVASVQGNVTGSVASVVGAVGSVTGNVGGNVTGSVGSVAAGGITAASIATGAVDADALATDAVNEIRDAILADSTPFNGADIDAAISTLATPADVNAQVLDVLTVDTFTELSAVPAATSTLLNKLNWLFALARNKRTTTSTTDTLRNDADNNDIASATVSDDGTTFTRTEWS